MALLPIVTLPDPVLRQVSTPIGAIDADVKRLADDMLATMYDAPGIGLAAIQVGVPTRLVVVDVGVEGDDEAKRPMVLVNPRIVSLGAAMRASEEGCLSLPDVKIEVERPATVTVAYRDLDGTHREIAADGLLATALQHEIDHLDGKLIIDFLTKLRRDMIVRRFRKKARGA
jgi:peptide deformylase